MRVAADKNIPPMQVALAWNLSRPGVTAPIVGATKLEQLDQAVAAVEISLEQEEMRFLEEAYTPRPLPQ